MFFSKVFVFKAKKKKKTKFRPVVSFEEEVRDYTQVNWTALEHLGWITVYSFNIMLHNTHI